MRLAGKKRPKYHASQAGFTLLELLLVVAILSSLALAATAFVDTKDSQERYETTKNRLEMIRTAILGKPDSMVNGQSVVSGFVADMGRLPDNLRELLQSGHCSNGAYRDPKACSDHAGVWTWLNVPCSDNSSPSQSLCEASGYIWHGWKRDTASGLTYGWRGPYLQALQSSGQPDAFTDGWGRESTDGNYGWVLTENGGRLGIASYGSDQRSGPGGQSCGDNYESDCAIVIAPEDYQADIGNSLAVNFIKPYQGVCANTANGGVSWLCTNGKCENSDYSMETTCNAKGGSWEENTWTQGSCSDPAYNTQAGCEAAGVCSNIAYTNQTECLDNGEIWAANIWTPGFCSNAAYADQASCEAAGLCANPNFTNQANCESSGICSNSIFTNKSNCESNGICIDDQDKTTKTECESVGKTWTFNTWTFNTWTYETYQLCQRLYYRSNGTVSVIDGDSGSTPVVISKNGGSEVALFGFASNLSIRLGTAALDILEDDISNTYSCGNNVKSSSAATPIPLQFISRASAPVININLLP